MQYFEFAPQTGDVRGRNIPQYPFTRHGPYPARRISAGAIPGGAFQYEDAYCTTDISHKRRLPLPAAVSFAVLLRHDCSLLRGAMRQDGVQ